MIILGINGSPDGGHDASACIVKNGELCVMAEEERFIRKKHAYDMYPHVAMQYCLQYMGISIGQVGRVAFSWDLSKLYKPEEWLARKKFFLKELFPQDVFGGGQMPECSFIPHHLAHAASTFWLSGFDESSILSLDGQGEESSGIMAYGNQAEGVKIIREFPIEYSLGYLYKAASGFAGLGRENPGKLMGLSSYGNIPTGFPLLEFSKEDYRFKEIYLIKSATPNTFDNMEEVLQWWTEYFLKNCNPLLPLKTGKQWDFMKNEWLYQSTKSVQEYADFAALIQYAVEKIGCHLVQQIIRETKCSKISLAGGVALNCSMNGRIAQMSEVEDLFIFPAAHDSGTSAGAALQLSFELGIKPIQKRLTNCYLGPNFTNGEIQEVLEKLKIKHKKLNDDDIDNAIAELLCANKIVAIFQGRSEIGPRALGHRSIIASPCSIEVRDRVNRAKGREMWRPLCPSVLKDYADEYFLNADKGSPFMLRFLYVRNNKKHLIPGVVHVDNTSRVQLVDSESRYGRMIKAFYRKSDVPLVLNTSFNLAVEPIVSSPIDAIKSFFASSIDVLVLENFLIIK